MKKRGAMKILKSNTHLTLYNISALYNIKIKYFICIKYLRKFGKISEFPIFYCSGSFDYKIC